MKQGAMLLAVFCAAQIDPVSDALWPFTFPPATEKGWSARCLQWGCDPRQLL